MLFEETKILPFNQYYKSDKKAFFIYADFEHVIEMIGGCKKNTEKSFTTKAMDRILSGSLMFTLSSFKSIENNHVVYSGEDCMKIFCKSLREHAMKIINFEKNKMKLLTN